MPADKPVATLPPIPDDIPDADVLERRQARYRRTLGWIFAALLVVDAAFLVHLVWVSNTELDDHVHWTWPVIGLLHWLQISSAFLWSDARPLEKATRSQLGPYKRGELKKMVAGLLLPFRDREQPNVYVKRSADPMVGCVDSWLFDFLRPLNAIHVHSIVLHMLRPDELRAILGHELGHFYRYIYPLRRGDFFVFLFFGLAVAETGWWLGSESFVGSLLWGVPLYFALFLAFGFTMAHGAKDQEHLCDLFGARQTSKLSMVNSLLQLGKGLEASERVFQKLLRRLAADARLPMYALGPAARLIDERLPQRLLEDGEEDPILDAVFAGKEMEKLRSTQLSESEAKSKAEKLQQIEKEFEHKPSYRLHDWSEFDFVVPDLRVDEQEYPYLIRRLVEKPERQLANFTFDNEKDSADKSVHPTLRRRILFLEKNLPDAPA